MMVKNQGKGRRLDGNKVKIRSYNQQFSLTIPKAFALGYGLKHGSIVELELTQRGILIKRAVDDNG